jgi:hypothetical protein
MKRLIESLVRLERRKEVARGNSNIEAIREMETEYCGRDELDELQS